ncbi:MAG: hypothetical protein AAGE61_13130 [Pseudomonadota bacterium]
MTTHLGVSVARDLDVSDIASLTGFSYDAVLDLRFENNGAARPMCERTLTQMRRYFVDYTQMPTNFDAMDEKRSEAILAKLGILGGDVLVLTDQMNDLVHFCDAHYIFHRAAKYSRPRLAVIGGMDKAARPAVDTLERKAS